MHPTHLFHVFYRLSLRRRTRDQKREEDDDQALSAFRLVTPPVDYRVAPYVEADLKVESADDEDDWHQDQQPHQHQHQHQHHPWPE